MSNPFFTAFGGQAAAPQTQPIQNGGIPGLINAARQLKANPMQYILQRKLNVPMELINDPNAILNHLVHTGQVSQDFVDSKRQQLFGMQGGRR